MSKYSQQSIQWLQYISNSQDIHIQHEENGDEYRINISKVNGFDEINDTVYKFYGCFWHEHLCHLNADLKKWEKNKQRYQAIIDAGYNLVTITSCEWLKMPESKSWYRFKEQEKEEIS